MSATCGECGKGQRGGFGHQKLCVQCRVVNGVRVCGACLTEKPFSAFTVCRSLGDGRQVNCQECVRPVARAASLRKRYALTDEELADLKRNGCWTCGSFDELNVDHDHACCPGKFTCGECVRGVLCRRHNHAVGNCQDAPDELRALAEYLENYARRKDAA